MRKNFVVRLLFPRIILFDSCKFSYKIEGDSYAVCIQIDSELVVALRATRSLSSPPRAAYTNKLSLCRKRADEFVSDRQANTFFSPPEQQ
jgi:hypothetical protein